jgi:hypothetical protein
MTGTAHAGHDLTSRVFRALYRQFDLCTIGDTCIVVPKGTSWFTGHSLGEIARQISDHEHAESLPGTTDDLAGAGRAG